MLFKKKIYLPAYEVQGVPPLSHDFEEIKPLTRDLRKIGIYTDKYYLFYCHDGFGKAYYEKNESEKSAESAYSYFSSAKNVQNYIKGLEGSFKKVGAFLEKVEQTDLSIISNEELIGLFFEGQELDEESFTYFLASQPHRLIKFEDKIRAELRKKVALVKVDEYMSQLATSEKQTKLGEEELEWLKLVQTAQKHKTSYTKVNLLEKKFPKIYERIDHHFQIYKLLSLGDGNWNVSIDYYLNNFIRDIKKNEAYIAKRIEELESFEQNVLVKRNEIIKILSLSEEIVLICTLLAELGHIRLLNRIEGWIPIIYGLRPVSQELGRRLEINPWYLMFTLKEELEDILKGGQKLDKELLRKRSDSKDYLMLVESGHLKIFYGEDAVKKYKRMVPQQDLTKEEEVKGMVAMSGKVQGKVCLYNWGDDLEEKINQMKQNKILVAGHTRPAMMPLIREALGIVTDEGGITSHAAIVSRELKIPSVINTKNATKVFKDGELVEIDALKGVVRKL
jgi:phosphohistidine swiveling domain-containing protein